MRRLWRLFWDAFWTAFDRARQGRGPTTPVATVPFVFCDDPAHPVLVPMADAPQFLAAVTRLYQQAGTRQEIRH